MSDNEDLFADVEDDFPGKTTESAKSNDTAESTEAAVDNSHEEEDGDLFASAVDDPNLSSVALDDDSKESQAAALPEKKKPSLEKKNPNDDFFIEIMVSEPEKVGDGMSSFLTYKVETKTNIPAFRKTELLVKRRFSDFLGLYEKLFAKYGGQCRILPQPPAKSLVGMIKVKKTNETPAEEEFVERRRAELERFMNRLANHSVIKMDPDFREFLEHEGDLPRATSTQALSGAGVMRLFRGIGDSVSKLTAGYVEESDAWFDTKAEEVNRLEEQLKRLHTSAEALSENRHSLAGSTRDLYRSCNDLAACEENTALARAISQLSETQEKLQSIHQRQSETDFYKLAELFRDYLGLIQSTKDAFHTRIKLYKTWQESQTNLAKKREIKAKLELANKTDKIPAAENDIRDAEQKVETDEEEFNRVSATIKKEVAQLEQCRVADFKANLITALESMLSSQEDILHAWETFLPEAKSIA